MNGKTVRMKLMRNRTRNIWGRRAYLVVSIPRSLAEPEPEQVTFPGFTETGFIGTWTNPDQTESIVISECHTGTDPTERLEEPIHHVHHYGGTWTFWQGAKYRTVGVEENGRNKVEVTPLDEATITKHRAWYQWWRALGALGRHPVIDALSDAGDFAKSTQWYTKEDKLCVAFGVKWFKPRTKLRFSAALSRAIKLAKRVGIPIRVTNG